MPLTLYQRGNIWHYRGSVAGRRLRGSCKTSDRKIAERVKAEVEAKAWQGKFEGPGAALTMAQVFHAYLDAEKPARFLLKLAAHWKDTPVALVFPETIRQAARKLYPNASAATWNRQVIKPTQAAINHAAGLGWCQRVSVKRFPETNAVKTPATLEWVQSFYAQAVIDDLPHLGALCVFMFGTGARAGESCRLTWTNVDLDRRTAKLMLFKSTPWERTAHLQPMLVNAITAIPSNRNPDDRVFKYAGRGSVKGPWANVCDRAGIEQLTPHCCRHGFATSMLHRGFDVKTVAERGGWKDATTVLRTYAHALTDRTVTDALFDTKVTQQGVERDATNGKEREKTE
ncbi:tyrosine-type recombinase/integrase [Thalassobius sp. S69A]|uniref:tyrosine-type recombinase/integrase n=1 Tax=unclassified Thalassovita TaxID=2619711 RepID=UPI000C1135F8|nr:site-specific integrase [Paracoccaceae bacterium]MBT25271.1 site-specific integrase [Paracoccaceae bacterium]